MLDAIATHQGEHEQSFSDLCKQALHQYLLSREPTQSVLLFMELQQQLSQLGVRVAALEQASPEPLEPPLSVPEDPDVESEVSDPTADDPVLDRLGPLLDDF